MVLHGEEPWSGLKHHLLLATTLRRRFSTVKSRGAD